MNLLRWLFGAKPALKDGGVSHFDGHTVEIREVLDNLLEIPALDFIGFYSRSPNGQFTLGWRDGDGSIGGARDNGDGHYVLLDGRRVAAVGRMERPNDGKVADDGTFILNDWHFSSELSSTFWAFRSDGSLILSRPFSANLFNNGLSDDGSLGCCQTCNSSTEDSGILAIFDLRAGAQVSSFPAESGWANHYEFLPNEGGVRLGYANEGGVFTYALSGEFLDRERWLEARLERGDLYLVKRMMEEAANRPPPALAGRLLACVDIGLRHRNYGDDRSQAFGWRLKGEILEASGELGEAILCYEKALVLNPKIGIKRRVAQLKKSPPG